MNSQDCKTNPQRGDAFTYSGAGNVRRYVMVMSNDGTTVGFFDTVERTDDGDESIKMPLEEFARRAANWDIAPP